MKKFLVIVAFVVMFTVAPSAFGQKSVFNSLDECKEAFANQTFKVYQSIDRSHFNRNASKTYLEVTSCVRQDVAGMNRGIGGRWTIQDTTIAFTKNSLGVITHRWDCGNKVYEVVALKTEVAIETETETEVKIENCPEGYEPDADNPRLCTKIVYKDKIEYRDRDKNVYINPCPEDIEPEGYTSMRERLTGGEVGAVVSAVGSVLGSKAKGASWKKAGMSGVKAVGVQRVQQAFNAGEDGIELKILSFGINTKVGRGKNQSFEKGIRIEWLDRERFRVFRKVENKDHRCYSGKLSKSSNLSAWIEDDNPTKKPVPPIRPNEPVKKQPDPLPGQDPIDRPGVGIFFDQSGKPLRLNGSKRTSDITTNTSPQATTESNSKCMWKGKPIQNCQ